MDAFRDRFTGVKVQLLPSGPLSVLAPAAASGDAVNLLQGALAVSSPLELGWRSWRVAAVLAASLLCLHLGARWFELIALAQERSRARCRHPGGLPRRHARRSRTRPTRAGASSRRLNEIRGGGGGGTLLPALSAVASARSAAPAAKIEGFTFRDGTLDLRIIAPDAASLDAIGQQLRAATWQADIMGGSASGDSYRGQPADSQGGCLMRAWYANLAERERRMVTFGAVAAAVLVVLAVVLPLNRNIAQARQRITTKQGDLAFIQSAAPQLSAAGPGVGRGRHRRIARGAHRQFGARERARQIAVEQPADRRQGPARAPRQRGRSMGSSPGSRDFRRVTACAWNPRKSNPPAKPGS